jgi:hypothetical protein
MARLVGKNVPEQAPEGDPAGGSAPAPVTPEAPKMPTVDEILAAIGVNNEALRARIAALLATFPNGIPQQILADTVNNVISSAALLLKIGEVYVAAEKFAQTGKGPVGHASVEVA